MQIVRGVRALTQMFPQAGDELMQINDLMQRVQLKIMSGGQPGEAAAPPVNG